MPEQRNMPDVAASQARFSATLSIAADAIITVDEEQRVLRFNHGAQRIFGYTERDIVGQPLVEANSRTLRKRYQRQQSWQRSRTHHYNVGQCREAGPAGRAGKKV